MRATTRISQPRQRLSALRPPKRARRATPIFPEVLRAVLQYELLALRVLCFPHALTAPCEAVRVELARVTDENGETIERREGVQGRCFVRQARSMQAFQAVEQAAGPLGAFSPAESERCEEEVVERKSGRFIPPGRSQREFLRSTKRSAAYPAQPWMFSGCCGEQTPRRTSCRLFPSYCTLVACCSVLYPLNGYYRVRQKRFRPPRSAPSPLSPSRSPASV